MTNYSHIKWPFPADVYGTELKYVPLIEGMRYDRTREKNDRFYSTMETPPIFVRGKDGIILSAEENINTCFADYYGEYAPGEYHGHPWVHPDLELWAGDHGCYWEWENPGCLVLVKE